MNIINDAREFYKEGYEFSISKAKGFQKVAEHSALENEFGIACSLNVLAAEEALKASFLVVKHNFPDAKLNDYDKIFKDHKIKHKHLMLLVQMQNELRSKMHITLPIMKQMLDIATMFANDKNDPLYISIVEDYNFIKNESERKLNVAEIEAWIETANEEKNNGFYLGLDFKNNKWIKPPFTKDKFEKERIYTADIIQTVINVNEVYERLERNKHL